MFSFLERPNTLDLKPPEAIWLEPNQLDPAAFVHSTESHGGEVEQWQIYLNELGLSGFRSWLEQRAMSFSIIQPQCINQVDAVYNFQVRQFKLNLIVREHVLDEVVDIHKGVIEQPSLAAHFHVLLEVLEEQKCVIIRGLLRYDRLIHYCNQVNPTGDYYTIPLSIWDAEPDHLLFYCRLLEPDSIPLPIISVESVTSANSMAAFPRILQEPRIKLGQWVQDIFTQGWQAIDELFNPDVYFAGALRNAREGAKRGKLIDLGMELPGQRVVLLVNVTEDSDQNLSVLVQLHPVGEERFLMPGIALVMLSHTGTRLQEVHSRTRDNYIQLKKVTGRSGIPFSIEISLGNYRVLEHFEL
jgi:hypothetical protein